MNGKVNKHLISNGTLLDIGILKENLNLVSLKYNNIEYDLTNKILELKHTTIEKL